MKIILITGVLCLWVETVAWILDAKYGFRKNLIDALNTMEPVKDPVSAQITPSGNDQAISMRIKEESINSVEPFILGGRVIPDAHYFAPDIKTRNFRPEDLPQDKHRRIFIVGGSAAFGLGCAFENSFGYLLEQWLGKEKFKVFNAAHFGFSSGEIVPVAKRIVDFYKPYAIIIYSGNNEWSHWVPAGQDWVTKRLLQRYRFLAQSRTAAGVLYLNLKRVRVGKKGQQPKIAFQKHQDIDGFDYALKHPAADFSDQDAAHWAAVKNNFLNTFENNLEIMIDYCRTHNVRILLLTVPFHYQLSVAWKHPQPQSMNSQHKEEVRSYLRDTVFLIKAQKFSLALTKLDTALEIDPLVPILSYLKAFCLEQLGQMTQAEKAYGMSRENMIGNLGSCLSINRRIHSVARKKKVEIIDAKEIFDVFEHSQGAYFNEHLILDDCHPTVMGHRLIAKALMEALTQKD